MHSHQEKNNRLDKYTIVKDEVKSVPARGMKNNWKN